MLAALSIGIRPTYNPAMQPTSRRTGMRRPGPTPLGRTDPGPDDGPDPRPSNPATAPATVPREAAGQRKQDAVYADLLAGLVSGRYRLGEQLQVRAIAERTGASKHPIMSALRELRAQGFVRIVPQVGCEVVAPSPAEIADFFVMFSRMEGVMAELAAQRREPADVVALRQINDRIAKLRRRDADSGEQYRLLNREFHGAVHRTGRSPALHERLTANWAMSDFLISQSGEFKRRLGVAAAEHDDVIDAIAAGATAKARAAMEAHILGFRLKVVEGLLPAGFGRATGVQAGGD